MPNVIWAAESLAIFKKQLKTERRSLPYTLDPLTLAFSILFLFYLFLILFIYIFIKKTYVCVYWVRLFVTIVTYCCSFIGLIDSIVLICKSLWIKASANQLNVNVNVRGTHQCVASHTPNHKEPTFTILTLITPTCGSLYRTSHFKCSKKNCDSRGHVSSLTSKTSKEIRAYQLSWIRTWPSISRIEGTLHPEACWRWLLPSRERRKVHAESETKREGNVLPLHPQKMGRLVYKLDMLAMALILCQNVAYWFIFLTFSNGSVNFHVNVNMYRGRGSGNWTANILDRNILRHHQQKELSAHHQKGEAFLYERFQQDISA